MFCIGSNCISSWPTGNLSGGGTANYIPVWTGSNSLGNSIIYQSGSNIGIGTTTPTKKLEVSGGSVKVSGNIGTYGYDPDSGYPSGWGGGVHTWDIYAEGTVGLGQGGALNAWINNAGNAYFAGNVGIGTNSPAAKLHVTGGSYGVYGEGSTYGGYFRDSDGTSYAYVARGRQGIYAYANGSDSLTAYGIYGVASEASGANVGVMGIASGDNGTKYALYGSASGAGTNWGLYISSGNAYFAGNVGIGTTSLSERLQVSGTVRASAFKTRDQSCPSGWTCEVNTWDIAAQSIMAYGSVLVSGNVGIGTTSPGAKLHVSGGDIYVDSGYGLRSSTGDLIVDAHATGYGVVRMYDALQVSEGGSFGGAPLWGSNFITVRTGYGDTIGIGGDSAGNDAEIRMNSSSRNVVTFWNDGTNSLASIRTSGILGDTGSFFAVFVDVGDIDYYPRHVFCMLYPSSIDWTDYAPCGEQYHWVANIYAYFYAPTNGTYDFEITSDDGVVLFINGEFCAGDWEHHGATTFTCSKNLTGGRWYPLYLEHFQGRYEQRLRLRWRRPGGTWSLLGGNYVARPAFWGFGISGTVVPEYFKSWTDSYCPAC